MLVRRARLVGTRWRVPPDVCAVPLRHRFRSRRPLRSRRRSAAQLWMAGPCECYPAIQSRRHPARPQTRPRLAPAVRTARSRSSVVVHSSGERVMRVACTGARACGRRVVVSGRGRGHTVLTLADVLARAREQAPQVVSARLALDEARGRADWRIAAAAVESGDRRQRRQPPGRRRAFDRPAARRDADVRAAGPAGGTDRRRHRATRPGRGHRRGNDARRASRRGH